MQRKLSSSSSSINVHPIPSVSGGCFGSDVGGALGGVPLVGGGLAVGAQYRGVEAGCALELALRAAAGVLVGQVRVCADGTGRFLLAPEVVVSIAEASGALGASIEAEVLGDLQAHPKKEEAFQGNGGVGASYDG